MSSVHSRGSSADRPPRPSGASTPVPGGRPGVLEISLDRPNPLQSRPGMIAAPQILNLLNISNSVLGDFHPLPKSEATSPKSLKDKSAKSLNKTQFEDDFPPVGDESLSSSEDEAPISRKMKALHSENSFKRQTTTVLMQQKGDGLQPQTQFTFSDEFAVVSLVDHQDISRISEPEKTQFDREQAKTLAEEITKLRQEKQKLRLELTEERTKVQRSNGTIAALEKLLASKDGDIQRLKAEVETGKREVAAMKQTERAMKAETEARKKASGEAERLTEELTKANELAAKLEQDVQYWKQKAASPAASDCSSNAKVESYLHELLGLKQIVTSFEGKNKELTAAYKALQKAHSLLREEYNALKMAPTSPAVPSEKSDTSAKDEEKKQPETGESRSLVSEKDEVLNGNPHLPKPSLLVSVRSTSAQMLSSLQQKFAKLQSDRDALQQALAALSDTESIQGRGKKHSLEMELGMINSTMTLLSEKIERYRK